MKTMANYATAEQVLGLWLEYVNAGKIEQVLALYNQESVLIPTFSDQILTSPEGIRDYFENLGKRPNLQVDLHKDTVQVREVAANTFALGGNYLWSFMLGQQQFSQVARFSYVIKTDSTAPIYHHHSSQMPANLG